MSNAPARAGEASKEGMGPQGPKYTRALRCFVLRRAKALGMTTPREPPALTHLPTLRL